MKHPQSRRRIVRAVAALLLPGQILLGAPLEALAQSAEEKRAEPSPPAAPPQVKVNRTPAAVEPAPSSPRFSDPPTTEEISRARIFAEPLIPVGGSPTVDENRSLAQALGAYLRGGRSDGLEGLEAFLQSHRGTPWRASLQLNLGLTYRRTGYFMRALQAWEEAWRLSREVQDPRGRAVADRTAAELLDLNSRLGRFEVVEELLAGISGRDVGGSAGERIANVREGLWLMRNRPEDAFRCGPLALDRIMALRPGYQPHPLVEQAHSTPRGTSLAEMRALAASVGLPMRMAHRGRGAAVVVPAMVHWRAGHFAALVREAGGRYLVQDPTFGDEIWVTLRALEDEATGYFLIPDGALAAGWREVPESEGGSVWGKGASVQSNPEALTSPNVTVGGNGSGNATCPMAGYTFYSMLVSLRVSDAPVGYDPPRGPSVRFVVNYNQRESFQPQTFSYANLGPKWTFDWMSYVEDDPANPAGTVYVYARGGGRETYSNYDAGTQSYPAHFDAHATVHRVSSSPVRYERRLPDGSVEVFAQANGAAAFPRKVFLTEWRDPQGNAVAFTYDAELRMVTATDAIGQVTTLSYENPDPLKITKVTDPFGRFATFEYDGAGRLLRITDVIGIVSEFAYGTGDFVSSLTTPYGTTRFAGGQNGLNRWLEAIDPLGGTERLEYFNQTAPIPNTDPPATVPAGFASYNASLAFAVSFYWDKRAMALAPGDYSKAQATHWLQIGLSHITSGTKRAEKMPLENRVWYAYAGQAAPGVITGTENQPNKIARVLDDGASQMYQYDYNAKGLPIKVTDPIGRETTYVYGTGSTPDPDPATGTGIDLLQVKQKNGGSYDLVAGYTHNAQHLPLTLTSPSGQTTTFTYNPQGQILTATTAPRAGITEDRTTTYTYDTNGYLQNVSGPAPGAVVSFTYDGYGRERTRTDINGHTLTYDYDALDRETKVTYPDGTYEETVYNRLDPERRRDRLGRWTHTFHDALRREVSAQDPLGRTTTMQWCNCGSLDKLIDGNNSAITWERDLQGRVTKETRADASFTQLVYENTTSRLRQRIDQKNQTTTYDYFLDDRLKQRIYTNAQHPTATVSFTYDPVYNRMATMTDGTGLTTWTYNPVTTSNLGAARLASIDGPLPNDTITYTYDEQGRVVGRAVNGVSVSVSLDVLGRIGGLTDPLGAFSYGYMGATPRLSSIGYPNGQTTTLDYFDSLEDHRLKEIKHRDPASVVLSQFNYTYDDVGSAKTWSQQAGTSTPKLYTIGYDAARQLTSASISGPSPLPVPSRFRYAYDRAGNRTAEQRDDVVTGATYNNLDQLASTQPGGTLIFRGTVSESATVSMAGQPAQVAGDNTFQGTAAVPSGTSTVSIVAQDYAQPPNVRTNTYQVSQSGATQTLTYDLDGNLTSDGARSFEWDAENRLIAVNQGTHRSEFTYDGMWHRVRIVEKDNSVVTSDKRFVWCGDSPCEERDSSGATVTKAFYRHGLLDGGVKYFATLDHLGSTREITDNSGAVRARYEYDPYGRMTKVSGTYDAPFGFTGQYIHTPTGLFLSWYRSYAPELGRWTSEDPAGLADGLNRYLYVRNDPLNRIDPDGRMSTMQCVFAFMMTGTLGGAIWGATSGTVVIPGWGTVGGGAAGAGSGAGAGAIVGVVVCNLPAIIGWCGTQIKKARGCTCTCLGTVDPNWNPTDPNHGDRYVGQQAHKAECRAECKFRGFDNYQCI